MTFCPAPQIEPDMLIASRDGTLATQLLTLAGELPGRVWLYYHHRQPSVSSEYYIEVFSRDTLSWNRVCEVHPSSVGIVHPADRPARMQAIADDLFATANAVLTAARTAEETITP